MAITIHIQPIGDDSDDENDNTQPSIKQEALNLPSIKSISSVKLKQPISFPSS